MSSPSLLASLSPDRPFIIDEGPAVVTVEFTAQPFGVVVAGAFVVVDDLESCTEHSEFACRSAACRPPTSGGTGGSSPVGQSGREGMGTVGPAVKNYSEEKVKKRSEHTMDRENIPDSFWNGKMVESARQGRLVPDHVKTGDEVVDVFADNIRKTYKIIDDHASQNPITKRQIDSAEKWYPAAGKIAAERGAKHGVSTEASAAVLAALSPGHDWDSNIREHEIVMNVVSNNRPVSAVTTAPVLRSILENQLKTAKTDRSRANVQAKLDGMDDLFSRTDGKPFNNLSAKDRAALLKAHAMVTEGPDAFTMQKWVLDDAGNPYPDGLRYTLDGKPRGINFQTEGTWEKVFKMLDADKGSGAELQTAISTGLGDEAKVRSFFNNIMYPDSPQHDVTIDTHATSVVVGRRVAQESPEYKQMSGGFREGAFSGPYAAGVEAYRRVADERGILGRAGQSQTWVAQKGMNDAVAGNPATESIRKTMASKKFKTFPPEVQEYFRKELEIRDAWLEVMASATAGGLIT